MHRNEWHIQEEGHTPRVKGVYQEERHTRRNIHKRRDLHKMRD